MRLAMDMCYFTSIHLGGKDETAFNLLRGFEELGVSQDIICFCTKDMVPVVLQYAPSVHICIVPQFHPKIKIRGMNRLNCLVRWLFEKYWLEKHRNEVDLFFMPNKPTPPWKFSMPTILLPHDVQVFECNKLPGVKTSLKGYLKGTITLKHDFKVRDHIIAISNFDQAEMIKFMPWAKHKIKRIYDPICFDKMGSNKLHGEEYLTVLNIQWLHKNVETVIRAYAKIADKINQTLILIGKVPSNIEYLKELVAEFGLTDKIIFTGFISTEELDDIVSKTRIYINASYFEGFGMTAVEMMGRGIPTIVAQNTAMPEVTRGLCYYYEPTDNSSALAKVILQELEHPMDQETLDAISNEMKKYYSYDIIAKEYWKFILKCKKNR